MIRPRPEGNEAGQTCSRHPAPPGFDTNLSLNHPPSRRATRIRSGRVAGLCPAARTTRTSSGFPSGALRRGALLLGFAAGMDPECSIRRKPMTNLVILVGRIARDPERILGEQWNAHPARRRRSENRQLVPGKTRRARPGRTGRIPEPMLRRERLDLPPAHFSRQAKPQRRGISRLRLCKPAKRLARSSSAGTSTSAAVAGNDHPSSLDNVVTAIR